jgi:hypothetical protein
MRPTRLTSGVATALLLLTSSPAPAQNHSREPTNRELRTKFNNLVEDRTWNISDTIRLPEDDGHQG